MHPGVKSLIQASIIHLKHLGINPLWLRDYINSFMFVKFQQEVAKVVIKHIKKDFWYRFL